MKQVIGALSALKGYCENKGMKLSKVKAHVDNIGFLNLRASCFAHARGLTVAADNSRTFAAMADAIQAVITEIERVIDAAHDEASAINAEIDAIIARRDGLRPVQHMSDSQFAFDTAVSVWKALRETACRYEDAFIAFHKVTDCDTFTDVCRAWLAAMDEAIAYDQEHNAMLEIKEVFEAKQMNAVSRELDPYAAHVDAERMEICMGLLYEGTEIGFRHQAECAGFDHNDIEYMRGVVSRAQPCAAAEHNAHYYQLLLAKRWKEQRVIMTTKDGAFNYILNDAIAGDMVQRVSLCTYTIDFRDGSVFDLRDGDWMPHGFYASVQSKRC